MTNPDSRQHIGRRTLVHSAWAVPAVSIAAAAPAYAATGDAQPWSIISASYEEGIAGLSGHYVLRFDIFVPAGQEVMAPQAFIRLSGNGGDMDANWRTGIAPDAGTGANAWSVQASDHGVAEEFRVHELTFRDGVMTGGASGATYTLYSDITLVHSGDIDANSRVEFVSSTPETGPTRVFRLLATNHFNGTQNHRRGYITVPHAPNLR